MKVLYRLFILLFLLAGFQQQSLAIVTGATVVKRDISCSGASDGQAYVDGTSITSTNPGATFTFFWQGGNIPGTSITDTVKGLSASNYVVRIRDNVDMSISIPFFFTVSSPNPLIPLLIPTDVSCFGICDGQIQAFPFGGTNPITYNWDDPAASTTSSISNLCAGRYRVTLTDGGGCTAIDSADVSGNPQIFPNINKTEVDCFGNSTGSATAVPTGGTGNFAANSYKWSSSANTSDTETGLVAGNYSVTVEDSDGCTAVENFSITQPTAPLDLTLAKSDAFCFGTNTGSITSSPSGGTSPYTFLWNDGSTNQNRNNITAGNYFVTMTDNNSCSTTRNITVNQPTDFVLVMTSSDVSCNAGLNGEASVTATSGSPGNRTFTWSTGQSTVDNTAPFSDTIKSITAGKYYVTVANVIGCEKIDSVEIFEPSPLIPAFDAEVSPSCNGGNDGSITASATGGTPPYTFNWSNGVLNSNSINTLSSGSYTVTVIDGNNCSITLTSTLTDPAPILPNLTPVDALCFGACDGSITANPSGGNAPYTYLWPSGNTGQTELNLCTGSYTVTVRDAGNCSSTETIFVGEPTAITVSLSASDAFCFGSSTGSITTARSGGTPPYTYAWADGPTIRNRTNVMAGNYTLTVFDSQNCFTIRSTTVGEPSDMSTSFVVDDVSCNSGADGQISLSVSGGVNGSRTFTWSTGASNISTANPSTSQILTLSAGKYYVTIRNVVGCEKIDSAEVFEPLPLQPVFDSQTDPLCDGFSDGTINISVSGGTPLYTYTWSDGSNAEDRTGLLAGNYTVTVEDSKNCTATISTTLNNPPVLTAVIDSTRDVSCFGLTDGFARVLAGGGTGTYTYAWSNGASTRAISNLAPGNYVVTVFDNNNCSQITTATVGAQTAVLAAIAGADATCNGVNNGTANASGSGGVPPYTYSWSPGGQTTQNISGLAQGTYTVTVEDANGCTDDESIIINQPAAISLTTGKTDVLCNGNSTGDATVSPTGGTLPYTYSWSPGSGTTQTISGLTAQVYSVTVTDGNNCTNSTTVTVEEPALLTANINTSNDPTCNGVNNGAATVTASGGPLGGTYTYIWAPDGETTAGISNKSAGVYSVTVTDNNNCTDTDQITLINPPAVIITLDTLADVDCFGGNNGYIGVIATGGTAPYTYNWLPTGGNSPINSGLIAGNYDLTVSDNNGCFSIQSFPISQPTIGLSSSSVTTDILCDGDDDGTAAITASGGTAPYTYAWPGGLTGPSNISLDGGTYNVTITDDKGCFIVETFVINEPNPLIASAAFTDVSCNGANDGTATASATGGAGTYTYSWTPAATGANLTNLSPGFYTVTVTDGNLCTDSASFTINQSNALSFNRLNKLNVSCFGFSDGELEIVGSGGTPSYTYAWSTGSSDSLIRNLSAGIYTLTISDAAGCSIILNDTITEPTQLNVSIGIDKQPCTGASDGALTANETGGTAPYTYAWTGTTQSTKTVNNLVAGIYSVTVTDSKNCTATDLVNLTPSAPIIVFGATSSDITCFGANDGAAAALAGGGTGTLTYSWSDGGSGSIRANLGQGSYTVSIFDSNGCLETRTLAVNEPALLDPVFTSVNVPCNGTGTGSASSTPIGGAGSPYTFAWSTGFNNTGTTSSISNLTSGAYSLTVSDASGCDSIETFNIVANGANFTYTENVQDVSCDGSCDGSIEIINFSGGLAPYTYNWTGGLTGPLNTNLCVGNYTVTVQDANLCDTIINYVIGSPGALSALIATTNDTCIQGIGTATVSTVNGGNAPYTYTFSAGSSSGNTVSGLNAGNYRVTINDAGTCTLVEPFTISNISTFSILPVVTDVSCKNFTDGSIFISTLGGVNPVTYNWNRGLVGANPGNLAAGFYDITVTDALGCAELTTVEVKEPDTLLAIISTVDESCTPGIDGSASANISGGTAPYTFAWSGGTASGNSTTGLVAGLYDLTVSDTRGCQFIDNFRIFNTAPFTVNFATTNASCNGGTDGEILVTVTGATLPLTYAWSGGLVGSNPTGLAAGNYNVTITDATTCSRTSVVPIIEDSPITVTMTTSDESCSPGNDAYAVALPIGGVNPYTYTWSAGTAFNDSVAGLSAGGYSVTIEDAAGCSMVESFTIQSGSDIDANESVVDPSCIGLCNGQITLNPTGGSGTGFGFAWSDGNTSASRIGLCAGAYSVTISDNAVPPCTKIESFNLVPPDPITSTVFINKESCNPGGNGGATLFIQGGTGPYVVTSSAGNVTANNIGNLSSGTYTATITDANFCTGTKTFTVTQSSPPTISVTAVDATCNGGNDGSITISTSGGSNPLTFNWTAGLAGANPANVSAGKYFVSVIDSKGCVAIDSAIVGEGVQITSNLVTIGESCSPGNDGSVTANATAGGTAPYTYNWGAGNTSVNSNTALTANSYSVTITDNIGCTEVIPYIINSDAPFNLTSSVFDVSCNGFGNGSINLTVTGATGTLVYTWDNGLPSIEDQILLGGGVYSVTITDQGSGCSETDQFTVNDPDTITIVETKTPESCVPGSDGTIDLNPTGGTTSAPGIYSYTWDNGLPGLKNQTGLSAGTYNVTVTDDRFCTATKAIVVTGNPPFSIDLDSTDITCNGVANGSILLTTTATNPTFLWDNGLPATQNQTGLSSGTYSVTVTNGGTGCTRTASISINEPSLIVANITTTGASCGSGSDGTASATASGGTSASGNYTFNWSNGQFGNNISGLSPGTYNVTVRDDNGCSVIEPFTIGSNAPFTLTLDSTDILCNGIGNGTITLTTTAVNPTFLWSNGLPATQNQTALVAGLYSVTVTEPGSGCTETASIQVNEPLPILASIITSPESCTPGLDGTASASASGGTVAGNYTFNWSTGSSGSTITGLSAGSYDLTIIDDNNCSVIEPFTIGSDAPFNVAIDTTDISCNGLVNGAIDLTITGATGTLSYLWDNSLPAQEDQTNLAAGTYNVTITDAGSGCTETASIPISEPSLIVPTLVAVDASCNLGNDGTASVTATGGTIASAYTFNWSTGATGSSISGLSAGNYDVTILDDNTCSVVELFTISNVANFTLDLDSVDVDCNGATTGSISLTTTAINPSFAWSNGLPASQNQSNIAAGNYTVTVTEPSTGCTKTASIQVNQPSAVVLLINKSDESCSPGGDGTASATATGGTVALNYTFSWSTGTNGNSISGLSAGNYTVTATDDRGCTGVNTFSINPASKILPNESSVDESCSGLCDGSIVLNPSGGDGNYTYTWNTGETTRTRTALCGGTYSVTINDGSGCDTNITVTINSNNPLSSVITKQDQSCSTASVCDGNAFVTVSGGTAPYTYTWPTGTNLGLSADTALSLCIGNYSVTVIDANSCSIVETFDINGPAPIVPNFSSTKPTCNVCNGIITVAPTGGTSNYSFEWFDASLSPLGNQTNSINSVCSGIYFVDITDDSGCSGRFSVGLSDIGSEAVAIDVTNINCFGSCNGQAVANYICLDPSCSVEWFDASTGLSLGIRTDTAKNLCPGDYFVQVINNSGCISIEPVTISSPDQFLISSSIQDVSCFGGFDGQISVNVSGGSPNYTYTWAPGPLNGQGTASVSGLLMGNYSLTLSDANSCDTIMTFTVGEAAEIQASFTTVDANCGVADGLINASITGGTVAADYDYQWLDNLSNPIVGAINPSINNLAAGTYFLRVRDDNGCEKTFLATLSSTNAPTVQIDSITNLACATDNNGEVFISVSGNNSPFTYKWIPQGQTSQDIANLIAGTYIVEVANSIGCIVFDTAVVSAPSELLASFNTLDASCGLCNGEASLTASGGTAPYTYLWSNGSTADTANALCAGVYSAVVSDANGCSKSFNFTVNANGGPTGATVSTTAASCSSTCDGTVTVQPIGGTAPYTYSWLHDGSTTSSLSNLCAGDYFLLISDRKGCSRNISVTIGSPAAISMTRNVLASTCSAVPCDGSIQLNVNGGTSPYTYAWTPGALSNSNVQNGLCAGIYQVTVSDANGCSLTESISVPNSLDTVLTNPSTSNVSCYGLCDGSLISNLSLSVDYNFQWFDAAGSAVAGINVDALNIACAGDYFLEITELGSGCKSYISANITEPDSILLGSSVVNNISCAGSCDGEIFISTTGGNILYNYSWNDPSNQDGIRAFDLCAGTYSVTATDANGCTASTSVSLIDPPVLVLSINSSTNLNCSSDCDATASVSPSGGVAPYTFDWSGGQQGNNPTTLCFGPNLVTLTDATGCSTTDTVFIGATDTVVAIVPNLPIICGLDSIHLTGQTLGNNITSTAWYEGNTTNLLSNSLDTSILRPFGSYVFFLVASNGSCSDTSRYDVAVVPSPIVGLASSVTIFKDEIAQIRLSGKNSTYLYDWTPGVFLNDSTIAEPMANPDRTITYKLLVTDQNNCNYSDSIKVIYTPEFVIPSGLTPNGDGVNDRWEIDFLEEFPKAKVLIYNRWGELLYEQKNGYKVSWDGTFEGKALPIGTYYYIIDLNSDRFEPFTGPITIVK